ncbi:MAG: hypothetical protein AAFN77_18540 [Planctomycetota bacterium]
MIENNLQRRRGRRRTVVPSTSLRGHFFALARQIRQWADSRATQNQHERQSVVVGVTSLDHGAGTSTVSFNLTCALASLCRSSMLLVESDFGRHYITRRLGHAKAPGLSEMLLGVATSEETIFSTPIADVSIMGCGTKSDQEALELPFDELDPLLRQTLAPYSYTVFDLPLASDLTACHSIAPYLDGIILTVDSNLIDQRRISRFKKQLETYGVEVIGIVLNKS